MSNDACGRPGVYAEADRYWEESGVRASSTRMMVCGIFGPGGMKEKGSGSEYVRLLVVIDECGTSPNSNFVPARMSPRSSA